jgi:hypothetical protein
VAVSGPVTSTNGEKQAPKSSFHVVDSALREMLRSVRLTHLTHGVAKWRGAPISICQKRFANIARGTEA